MSTFEAPKRQRTLELDKGKLEEPKTKPQKQSLPTSTTWAARFFVDHRALGSSPHADGMSREPRAAAARRARPWSRLVRSGGLTRRRLKRLLRESMPLGVLFEDAVFRLVERETEHCWGAVF